MSALENLRDSGSRRGLRPARRTFRAAEQLRARFPIGRFSGGVALIALLFAAVLVAQDARFQGPALEEAQLRDRLKGLGPKLGLSDLNKTVADVEDCVP